jgi:hypothetical protein
MCSLSTRLLRDAGGKQPFETDSLAGTMASVLHTISADRGDQSRVTASVSSVIRTMLAKDPAQRYRVRDVLVI